VARPSIMPRLFRRQRLSSTIVIRGLLHPSASLCSSDVPISGSTDRLSFPVTLTRRTRDNRNLLYPLTSGSFWCGMTLFPRPNSAKRAPRAELRAPIAAVITKEKGDPI
jgi:hypothetical protein